MGSRPLVSINSPHVTRPRFDLPFGGEIQNPSDPNVRSCLVKPQVRGHIENAWKSAGNLWILWKTQD
jgi:hypothetical protein